MNFLSRRDSSSALTFLKLLAYAGVLCIAGTVPGIAGTIVLYSTTGTGGNGSSLYANSLLTIDPATGAQELAGQPGQAADLFGLTYNPINNMLYGTGPWNSCTPVCPNLYTINPNSGAISGTVTLSQDVAAIAASPQGTLYGLSGNTVGNQTLGTINPATGQFSSVGTLSLSSGYFVGAMAFSPGGILYGVTTGIVSGPGVPEHLITVNPANAAMTSDHGTLTGNFEVQDITFAADGNIYATNFSYALTKIDPQTLSNTLVGFGNIGDVDGIASPLSVPPSVPEPGTLSLMGIAAVGLLIRLRNKTRMSPHRRQR